MSVTSGCRFSFTRRMCCSLGRTSRPSSHRRHYHNVSTGRVSSHTRARARDHTRARARNNAHTYTAIRCATFPPTPLRNPLLELVVLLLLLLTTHYFSHRPPANPFRHSWLAPRAVAGPGVVWLAPAGSGWPRRPVTGPVGGGERAAAAAAAAVGVCWQAVAVVCVRSVAYGF